MTTAKARAVPVHHANAAAAQFLMWAPNMERSSTHATTGTADTLQTLCRRSQRIRRHRLTCGRRRHASQRTCRDLFWSYHPSAACVPPVPPAVVISIIWLARRPQHARRVSRRAARWCVTLLDLVVRCRAREDSRRPCGRGMHFNIISLATRVRCEAVESISNTAAASRTRATRAKRASCVGRCSSCAY